MGWLGAVVLFVAWTSEKYLQAGRQSELAYLNQAQLLISVEEGHLEEWLSLLLVEQAKASPNGEVLRVAALKAAQHHLNILTWAIARVTDPREHETLLQDKARVQEKLTFAYERGDTQGLLVLLNGLNQTADSRGPALIAAFTKRYDEARKAEDLWRRLFLGAYVLGSLIVALGVVRTSWIADGGNTASANRPIQRPAKGRR